MTESDLDHVYTEICRAMERAGSENAALFLARFALLAAFAIGERGTVERLIADASQSPS